MKLGFSAVENQLGKLPACLIGPERPPKGETEISSLVHYMNYTVSGLPCQPFVPPFSTAKLDRRPWAKRIHASMIGDLPADFSGPEVLGTGSVHSVHEVHWPRAAWTTWTLWTAWTVWTVWTAVWGLQPVACSLLRLQPSSCGLWPSLPSSFSLLPVACSLSCLQPSAFSLLHALSISDSRMMIRTPTISLGRTLESLIWMSPFPRRALLLAAHAAAPVVFQRDIRVKRRQEAEGDAG